jgi:hypothetical protein
MQTLRVRFKPLDWTDSMGTLVFEPVTVTARDLMKNGYLPLHPYHFDEAWDPLYDVEKNEANWHGMHQLDGARFVADWWIEAAFENKAIDHSEYAKALSSELQRYSTVTFPTNLPTSLSEIIRFTKAKDTVVIRSSANYEDIVELALRRMADPMIWTQKFIEKLIYRIGTGIDDDSVMADLSEVRAVMKELRPEIKLKGWADFRALKLPEVFSPEDFREMEDVIVSVILDEKIVEYEAFIKSFTVEVPGSPGERYMSWNIMTPGRGEKLWSDWRVKMGGTDVHWWQVASAEGEVILEPEAGRTMVVIRKEMKSCGLDTTRTVPYHMSWDEFEAQLTVLHPKTVPTGVQIVCDTNLPKIIKFKGAPSFRDLTVDLMRKMCDAYNLEKGKDKDETWDNLMGLLIHEYPKFDRAMRDSLKGLQLIRVVNFEKNPPQTARGEKFEGRVFDLQDVVAEKFEHPILMQYMLSIFMLAHCYSGMIIRPSYVTTLFTLEGILESFKEVGYVGQDGNSTFYFMTDSCALPLSLPAGILAPDKGATASRTKADLNVAGADQLIADILGD